MIRNKDFALLYAGRAVFNKNGEYAGVVVGRNDMHGVMLGVDHVNGWQSWGANDIGVSEDEFLMNTAAPGCWRGRTCRTSR